MKNHYLITVHIATDNPSSKDVAYNVCDILEEVGVEAFGVCGITSIELPQDCTKKEELRCVDEALVQHQRLLGE